MNNITLTSTTSSENASLSVGILILKNNLHIEYRFKNTSDKSIYLFNKLARAGGASVFDIDKNAVNIVANPLSVVISKAMIPTPIDRDIERIYIPCMSKIEQGEEINEHIIIAYPLEQFTWYSSRKTTKNETKLQLIFELGYILDNNIPVELINNSPEKIYTTNQNLINQQQLITSAPLLDALVFTSR